MLEKSPDPSFRIDRSKITSVEAKRVYVPSVHGTGYSYNEIVINGSITLSHSQELLDWLFEEREEL